MYVPAQPQCAPRVEDGTDDPADADYIQNQLWDKGTQDGTGDVTPRYLGNKEACANNKVHELTE